MVIFVNCNNIDAFKQFIQTYDDCNKKYHYIIGRQDIGILNRKGLLTDTDENVKNILISNGITDFEFLHATKIDSVVPKEWKTESYNLLKNMLVQYLAPWYIFKYTDYKNVLFIEEDFVLMRKLDFLNNDCMALHSTLSLGGVDYGSEKAVELLKIQNVNISVENYYKYLYGRKIVGCPRYYTDIVNMSEYEQYVLNFYTNSNLYKIMSKSKTWHNGYMDEFFHSCSPIDFKDMNSYCKWILIGERRISKCDFTKLSKYLKSHILHIAGTSKIIILNKILEVNNG